jgi:hypothetical protein
MTSDVSLIDFTVPAVEWVATAAVFFAAAAGFFASCDANAAIGTANATASTAAFVRVRIHCLLSRYIALTAFQREEVRRS